MRVLLVDDHAVVRRGIRDLLAEAFADAVFEEASTGEEALALVRKGAFQLVVLDISMPRRGGMDALKDIQAEMPKLPVLVLSQHAEEQYAIRALRAGAAGYLTKDCAADELVRAARKALSGGKYVSEKLAEKLAGELTSGVGARPHERLSDRELQVLRMLAQGRAVKEIAADLSLSEKTISTYRARILEKTNMKSNAELMRYALASGLVE
ncbi:MAG TPA: response regulator transcription factor [Polyangia bacterium]|nr:response regulator transcription factor [Polyangia bacterium]